MLILQGISLPIRGYGDLHPSLYSILEADTHVHIRQLPDYKNNPDRMCHQKKKSPGIAPVALLLGPHED